MKPANLSVIMSDEHHPDGWGMGLTQRIEHSDAVLLSDVCFYQSYARGVAKANGWNPLTDSAKLTTIMGGYGYQPTLAAMAFAGRILVLNTAKAGVATA